MSTNVNKIPAVDTLYFEKCRGPSSFPTDSPLTNLPAELKQLCLVEYSDWGELAKLSNVQSEWSNLLMDAAEKEGKWDLAEAMLNGTNGLAVNAEKALSIMRELAGVKESIDGEGNVAFEIKGEVFPPAMRRIAECYLIGNGVGANTDIGMQWLEAAHSLGKDFTAAHEMALIFEHGKHDVEIDVSKAAKCFKLAAEGGVVEAMAEYALCCELGAGTDQDDSAALDWYIKAANNGHVTSKYSVAEIFEEARGVPQSDSEACLWYYKAAVCGDEDSKKALRRLYDVARIVVPGVASVIEA